MIVPTSEILLTIARTAMPFGRYKGRLLIDLPEPYVVWFARQGFPPGKLGQMLALVHEVKVNGLEHLFERLRETQRDPTPSRGAQKRQNEA